MIELCYCIYSTYLFSTKLEGEMVISFTGFRSSGHIGFTLFVWKKKKGEITPSASLCYPLI